MFHSGLPDFYLPSQDNKSLEMLSGHAVIVFQIFILIMYVFLCEGYGYVSADTRGCQKRELDPLALELNRRLCVALSRLGTELRSSVGAVCVSNYEAISSLL